MGISVKRILIEFDTAHDEASLPHATTMEFVNGKWEANGPVFSRFGQMAHEIWQVVRKHITA